MSRETPTRGRPRPLSADFGPKSLLSLPDNPARVISLLVSVERSGMSQLGSVGGPNTKQYAPSALFAVRPVAWPQHRQHHGDTPSVLAQLKLTAACGGRYLWRRHSGCAKLDPVHAMIDYYSRRCCPPPPAAGNRLAAQDMPSLAISADCVSDSGRFCPGASGMRFLLSDGYSCVTWRRLWLEPKTHRFAPSSR